jgi:hypothetical protein
LNSEVSETEAVTTGVFKALKVADGVKLVQVYVIPGSAEFAVNVALPPVPQKVGTEEVIETTGGAFTVITTGVLRLSQPFGPISATYIVLVEFIAVKKVFEGPL